MTDTRFESLLDRQFRWPRSGDAPFVQAPGWQDNAYIDTHGHGRFVMMMSGYKKGADLMVRRAETDPVERDALVFPIVFNYRQFIELSLKYLIATYGPAVGIGAIWDSHELAGLWMKFRQVVEAYGASDPEGSEADAVVASIVAEFAKVDPGSFSYRYPVDRKGKLIPMSHEQLDLAALADVMSAVDGYFTGCDGYLDSLEDAGL